MREEEESRGKDLRPVQSQPVTKQAKTANTRVRGQKGTLAKSAKRVMRDHVGQRFATNVARRGVW